MTYGTRIKQAREGLRLTQEQLAEQLDVSRQAVSKWEADLSRPTREKLDKLSEILNIPPETWAEIDAEAEAANKPPDTSRPWKIATVSLVAVCLILAVCLTVSLWPREYIDQADSPVPPEEDIQIVPPPEGEPDAPADTSAIYPDTLPLTVRRDFEFGDWPLGEYDPAEVPFLDNQEQAMANELWCGWFPDGARLSLVKVDTAPFWTDVSGYFNLYVLYAPPVEETGGVLDYIILLRAGEDYINFDGEPEGAAFANVLGWDGFRLDLSNSENQYRSSFYFSQHDDGMPCMMTCTEKGWEADVDEDGELEIIWYDEIRPAWNIVDTTKGEEGAFTYTLELSCVNLPDGFLFDFDQSRGGFLIIDKANSIISRCILRAKMLVLVPPTDFSAADYPDVAGTEITFITDEQAGILSDGKNPDELLLYNPNVRITQRQRAYLALQELYNMTGLRVERCYCAASEYGVHFSLLPDGFNQRSFYTADLGKAYGDFGEPIPQFYIRWKELDKDWSPLSIADAVHPEPRMQNKEEAILWYYDRMKIFNTGEVSCVNLDELWLENGNLYIFSMEDTEWGPVLYDLVGPYPNGEINH